MSSLFLISGPVGVVASLLFLLYLSGGREPDQGSPEALATGENRRLVVAEALATHRKIFFLKVG